MLAGNAARTRQTRRTLDGPLPLLAGLLRLLRPRQERGEVDVRPAAIADLLEITGPRFSRSLTAGHLRDYWRARARLADMMLAKIDDDPGTSDLVARLQRIRDQARRWAG